MHRAGDLAYDACASITVAKQRRNRTDFADKYIASLGGGDRPRNGVSYSGLRPQKRMRLKG